MTRLMRGLWLLTVITGAVCVHSALSMLETGVSRQQVAGVDRPAAIGLVTVLDQAGRLVSLPQAVVGNVADALGKDIWVCGAAQTGMLRVATAGGRVGVSGMAFSGHCEEVLRTHIRAGRWISQAAGWGEIVVSTTLLSRMGVSVESAVGMSISVDAKAMRIVGVASEFRGLAGDVPSDLFLEVGWRGDGQQPPRSVVRMLLGRRIDGAETGEYVGTRLSGELERHLGEVPVTSPPAGLSETSTTRIEQSTGVGLGSNLDRRFGVGLTTARRFGSVLVVSGLLAILLAGVVTGTWERRAWWTRRALGAGGMWLLRDALKGVTPPIAVGVFVGLIGGRWVAELGLDALWTSSAERGAAIAFNGRTVSESVALGLAAAILFAGSRIVAGCSGRDVARIRRRPIQALVACQLCVGVAVGSAATMLGAMLWDSVSEPAGVRRSGFVFGRLLPEPGVSANPERFDYPAMLESELQLPPRSVATAMAFPSAVRRTAFVEGPPTENELPVEVLADVVSSEFFDIAGLELILGRLPRAGDTAVAVLSESASARLFAGKEPIGLSVRLAGGGTPQPLAVVGIVRDVIGLAGVVDPKPRVYSLDPGGRAGSILLVSRPTGRGNLEVEIAELVERRHLDYFPLIQSIEREFAWARAERKLLAGGALVMSICALLTAGLGLGAAVVTFEALTRRHDAIRRSLGEPVRRFVTRMMGWIGVISTASAVIGMAAGFWLVRDELPADQALFDLSVASALTFALFVASVAILVGIARGLVVARRANFIEQLKQA